MNTSLYNRYKSLPYVQVSNISLILYNKYKSQLGQAVFLESVTQRTPLPQPLACADRKTKMINPSAVIPNSYIANIAKTFLTKISSFSRKF